MKKCAYCGIELTRQNKTKEHIIPHGLINLFPEQNITFTEDRAYKDNFGQSISDVCAKCNNEELGELDAYGVNLIKDIFMNDFKKDEKLSTSFDFNMLSRWLLKIAYNNDRVSKASCAWFEKNIDYILGKDVSCDRVSIFAGLHVDMNPLGEKNGIYLPLSIGTDLKFYDSGIIPYRTLMYGLSSQQKNKPLNFKDIYKSYSFRFASARFILILWKSSSNLKDIEDIKKLIEMMFPYTNVSNNEITLERANDNLSGRYSNLIVGYTGMSLMDAQVDSLVPDIEYTQKYFNEFGKKMRAQYGRKISYKIIW